jgi:hypothetical protein
MCYGALLNQSAPKLPSAGPGSFPPLLNSRIDQILLSKRAEIDLTMPVPLIAAMQEHRSVFIVGIAVGFVGLLCVVARAIYLTLHPPKRSLRRKRKD